MNIALRPIESSDVNRITELCNDRDIAKTTARLPYPYTFSDAETWLDYITKTEAEHVFAISEDNEMVGVVGLVHEQEHDRAEIGYWLGRQYWNRGIATASVEMMIGYAFTVLGVNKIYASVFAANTASVKVLEKNRFVLEGCLKQHYIRMDTLHDIMCFGLLKANYDG